MTKIVGRDTLIKDLLADAGGDAKIQELLTDLWGADAERRIDKLVFQVADAAFNGTLPERAAIDGANGITAFFAGDGADMGISIVSRFTSHIMYYRYKQTNISANDNLADRKKAA
jgi:hypothetical protein